MKYGMIVLWSFIFSVSVMQAQKVWTREDLQRVTSPVLLQGADTLLAFPDMEHQVGTLSEDEAPVVYEFSCMNISSSRIVITRLVSSCGCTEASVNHPVLMPGDKALIRLVYNPFGHPGAMNAQVKVYTQYSESAPVAVLKLTGEVIPSAAQWKSYRYTVGNLKLRRKLVDFGLVHPGQRRVERIACGNAGSMPMRVSVDKSKIPAYLSVYTQPEELQPSEEGWLVIELNMKEQPPGMGEKLDFELPLKGISAETSDSVVRACFQYGLSLKN